MSMIRTLVMKELSEHGWVLLAMFPLALFGFLLTLAAGEFNEAGSLLESVRLFSVSLLLLVEVVICNRLVVHEFTAKTQLFLEGLPISRSAMLWTKYLFGFTLVLLMIGACFLVAILAATRQEAIDLRFVSIMTTRLVVFSFCTYSFVFMMGLLGRYRIALYLALLLTVVMINSLTEFDFQQHGPLGLVNSQFAFERQVYPVENLLICGIAGVVFVAVSFAMTLVREGTVASLLAERMSHREKMFISALLLGTLFVFSLVDHKKTPDPYAIDDAASVVDSIIGVHVEPTAEAAVAQRLAEQVHQDLVAVCGYLNIDHLPELFIVNRRDLDAERYELARLENASGVLVRANYHSADWSYEHFRPWLIDACLTAASGGTAVHEPRCWVLEGFVEYWSRRQTFGKNFSDQCKLDLRAAYAGSLDFQAGDIDRWYRYRERVGPPIASAVASAALVYAEQQYGEEALQTFLRGVLRVDLPHDSRALWQQWTRPITVLWREAFGSDYRDFQHRWAEQIGVLEKQFEDQIATIPVVEATATMVALSQLSYDIQVTPQVSPEPADGKLTLRFEPIPVVDIWSDDKKATVQIVDDASSQSIRLKQRFPAGSRLRWTLAAWSPELGCEVISGWQRQEVR